MARATSEAGDAPSIEFVAEAERCPVCNAALKVYKSRSRQVITLAAGPFRAIETLNQCGEDATHPLMGSNALAQQVLPRQRYGYDLIVYVGCARYFENKQRGEIQAELSRQRGIALSTGSLSALCDRFLTYLEALHVARVAQLRAALGEGFPLHIDATCEHGKGGLFVFWISFQRRLPSSTTGRSNRPAPCREAIEIPGSSIVFEYCSKVNKRWFQGRTAKNPTVV